VGAQDIQSLNPRHFIILDQFLAGVPQKQIAESLGMSAQAVYIITNSPSFQHELAMRRAIVEENVNESVSNKTDEALNFLRSSSLKAAETIVNGMSSIKEEIAQKSAMDILDRVGVAKITKNQNNNTSSVFVLSAEDAKLLQETLLLDNKKTVLSQEV
jgi:hypothetical protein